MSLMVDTLSLLVLGCHVRVQCQNAEIRALLVANYGHMEGNRLQYRPEAAAPVVEPLSKAEAAARLFANALNPLAHAGDGLDEAIKVSARVASVQLFSADLMATWALV
jgi:hypothetical protein